MKHKQSKWILALASLALLAGCGRPASEPPAQAADAAPRKKLCWVQPLKGHPVHQLTQIAFREGCAKYGYDCEIIGTDGMDAQGTIALAEQALARGDVAGMVVWATSPAFYPFIERVGRLGIPVIIPHFPAAEGSMPGATGIISCDPADYAREAAIKIGRQIGGKGTVALTQGSFNSLENQVSASFASAMHELYPGVRVLPPEEEGFDSPKAISLATSLLQSHPDLDAAFSTTGGGPTTWAGAQRQAGRKIVAVGMDYTRLNLDLVKSGDVYAVVGQPLWEEAYGAAGLLHRAIHGGKIPWWTKLPAPFITRDDLQPYYRLLDKVEATLKK